ncbi:MAG: substrate-binding domain-containing protein, partial [Treponema sp.]|nr:substrate-binding domain-containing protein [Treponema sp.]
MKKILSIAVAVLAAATLFVGCKGKKSGAIKVGIINNPPSESGYRAANVKDMEEVFSAAKGYEVKTFYSLKNDEQLNAASQFITEGVDYILLSAAATDGWDAVLKNAQKAGIKVFLFDRMINTDESLYEAAVVSDMANQ